MPYYLIEGQEDTDSGNYQCSGPKVNEGIYKDLDCQTAYNKELEKTDDISMANKWCNIAPECNLTQITTDDNKDMTNTTNISLQEQFNNLEQKLSGNLTTVLMDNLDKINNITDKSKLYNSDNSRSGEYINKIKNMTSIYDLGDPNNSDELDFMENIIINFLEIPDNTMGDLFSNYCNEDFNVTILLSLAVFYNKTDDSKGNTVNVDRLLNRLGRYLPDVFKKILTGMKTCYPDEPNKYDVLEHIYKKMFKFNETNVDLGLMDGVTNIFKYLKGMKTIEMVVIIIAFAFVVSKIFDMFRVKVDV
jgi:hypothetical protein